MDLSKAKPTTLEEAVDFLDGKLAREGRVTINATTDMAVFHHSIGQAMRNAWSLWEPESPLQQHFRKRFRLGMADDISGFILEELGCRVKGLTHNRAATVKRFHDHWARQGLDPVTLKEARPTRLGIVKDIFKGIS
jgi:hypothetical protein